MKLIYVSFVRLTKNHVRDCMIEYFHTRGVNIEFWDIVQLVRDPYSEHGQIFPDYLKILETKKDLKNLIQENKHFNPVYYVQISYGGRFLYPFRLLRKFRCKTVFFLWGRFPLNKPERYLYDKIRQFLKYPFRTSKNAFYALLGIIYKKLKLVHNYDIVFCAGNQKIEFPLPAKSVVPVNSIDYECYHGCRNDHRYLIKNKYAVFLDSNFPFHKDLSLLGYQHIDPVDYFESLNSFFKRVESRFQLQVVIASHPKSDYASNAFEGRMQIQGETPKLVKDAELVITHASTAINYAVLNYKPVIFVYNNQIRSKYRHLSYRFIRSQASYLKSPLINVSQSYDLHDAMLKIPDRSLYDDYKYEFLTSRQCESRSTREIIYNELMKMMKINKVSDQ